MSDYTESYDSYDYSTTYEVTTVTEPYAPVPTFDPGVEVQQVDSYSYDSTDWGAVAEVSGEYMADYDTLQDVSWDMWNASTDAWLAGDTDLAYDLNQMSISFDSASDVAWDQSMDVWATNEVTTVSTYETVDTSYTSYDTTSYDTTSSYDTSSDW